MLIWFLSVDVASFCNDQYIVDLQVICQRYSWQVSVVNGLKFAVFTGLYGWESFDLRLFLLLKDVDGRNK